MPVPPPDRPDYRLRVRGCLLGGALGDALGGALGGASDGASNSASDGAAGAAAELHAADVGRRSLAISSATQLSLYTADGLLEALEWAHDGVGSDELACLWLAYLRWFAGQGGVTPASAPVPQRRWIDHHDVLRRRRHPDPACLDSLATGEMGMPSRPVSSGAAGAGAVVRSAPLGLLPHVGADWSFAVAGRAAALTHDDPDARRAASVLSLIVHALVVDGAGLHDAVDSAVRRAADEAPVGSLVAGLDSSVRLARSHRPLAADPSAEDVAALGDSGSSAGVLAVAVYAVLSTCRTVDGESVDELPPKRQLPENQSAERQPSENQSPSPVGHFNAAVDRAAALGGDAASAVTGNILGACYGTAALDATLLRRLDAADVVEHMTDSLLAVVTA